MEYVDTRMRKRDFLFYLKRLAEQKKRENEAMESSRKSVPKASAGKMKYLGR